MGTSCSECGEFNNGGGCACETFHIVDSYGDESLWVAGSEQHAAARYAEESEVYTNFYLMTKGEEIKVNGNTYIISAKIQYNADKKQ